MQFTEAEKRFLHRDHGEFRLGKLLTLDEFRALGCPGSRRAASHSAHSLKSGRGSSARSLRLSVNG